MTAVSAQQQQQLVLVQHHALRIDLFRQSEAQFAGQGTDHFAAAVVPGGRQRRQDIGTGSGFAGQVSNQSLRRVEPPKNPVPFIHKPATASQYAGRCPHRGSPPGAVLSRNRSSRRRQIFDRMMHDTPCRPERRYRSLIHILRNTVRAVAIPQCWFVISNAATTPATGEQSATPATSRFRGQLPTQTVLM